MHGPDKECTTPSYVSLCIVSYYYMLHLVNVVSPCLLITTGDNGIGIYTTWRRSCQFSTRCKSLPVKEI